MTGYDVYKACRSLVGWTTPELDVYLHSSEKPYYEMLAGFLIKEKNLPTKNIYEYLRAIYAHNPTSFDPYKLMDDECWKVYENWCKTCSTKELYFDQIRKSFIYIENFCINKSISLDQYKLMYASQHIRQKKIEYVVAVHLQLVDRKKLNKVEKLLLKNFLSQYNIIQTRLSNLELSQLLIEMTQRMTKLLQAYHQGT